MMKKKSVKLVFKDTVDIQNFYAMGKYIKRIIHNADCTCYHVFNSYEKEFANILKDYLSNDTNTIKVKKIKQKPKFSAYFKNYIERIIYFASNSLNSPSAFHKLLEYLFFPRKLIILKITPRKFFIQKKPKIKNISFEDFLLKNYPALVIFFRPDSIHNTLINLDKNDTTVNVLRNLDTPFLKGTPTIQADFLFNIHYPIIKEIHLKAFKKHNCINFSFFKQETPYEISYKKKKINNINILYAMSHTNFAKNEIGLVVKLREILPNNINLKVKLHGSNPEYFLKFLSEFNLIDKKLFAEDKPNFTTENINKQYKLISKYNVCIGLATTFFLKAYISGIKYNFFISDKEYFPYTGMYSREHSRLLFEYINAIEIKNINYLPKILSNLSVE